MEMCDVYELPLMNWVRDILAMLNISNKILLQGGEGRCKVKWLHLKLYLVFG